METQWTQWVGFLRKPNEPNGSVFCGNPMNPMDLFFAEPNKPNGAKPNKPNEPNGAKPNEPNDTNIMHLGDLYKTP